MTKGIWEKNNKLKSLKEATGRYEWKKQGDTFYFSEGLTPKMLYELAKKEDLEDATIRFVDRATRQKEKAVLVEVFDGVLHWDDGEDKVEKDIVLWS